MGSLAESVMVVVAVFSDRAQQKSVLAMPLVMGTLGTLGASWHVGCT
jgi:hypothetical protein